MAAVSGRTILQELDNGLMSLRRDVQSLDSDIVESGQRMGELGEAKLSLYKKLAERRLAQLERGDLLRGIDIVSHEVANLLERRQQEHGRLLEEIRHHESGLDDLEAEREQIREQVETAALKLDEAEAVVQDRLDSEPTYKAQLERAHEADAIANEAEAKTGDAIDDKKSKGEPFESDRLFMYLWRRRYGTSEYSANPLTRTLDRWVAKLCNYDKARPNYWMLNEIPVRLQAHADAARERADAEFEQLKQLEADAAEELGLPRMNEELDAREQALAECDEAVIAAERKLAELSDERAQFAAARDPLMQETLDRLAAEMKSDGIEALRRRAASTPDREDDRIVEDIVDVDERLELLEQEHRDRQKIYSRQDRKIRDLAALRQQFKQRGYDDMRSIFTDGSAVAAALQQFLGGLLDDDDLWRIIARLHRLRQVRSRPGFGSGGFRRRPGTWRVPRSGPGWQLPPIGTGGGLRFPSGVGGRRRGGGGFSTGGGF